MIRIISGKYRGRKIKVHPGKNSKASSDQFREGLFNILSSIISWEDITVIDFYAGSGSLGLEALSRGAKKVIFIEADNKKIKTLIQNIELLSLDKNEFELIRGIALKWIKKIKLLGKKYIIFIDPPFSGKEYEPLLRILSETKAIKKNSFIILESHESRKIIFPKNMQIIKIRRYGSVILHILQKF